MFDMISVLANDIVKPDYKGVGNYISSFEQDPTWWKSTVDAIGSYITTSICNAVKSIFTSLIVTGQCVMYWVSIGSGIYCSEKFALTRDKKAFYSFYKCFLIYLILAIICTIL
nr:MAG TPA: hypothetical protein [Caudoviricetes sp.]